MKKDTLLTLKLILISLVIHLLFCNPILSIFLLIVLSWPIFGGYVIYTNEYTNEEHRYKRFGNFDVSFLLFADA